MLVTLGLSFVVPDRQGWLGLLLVGIAFLLLGLLAAFALCALQAGLMILMCRLAKGRKATLADMFSGGQYAFSVMVLYVIQQLIQTPLTFALQFPGALLAGALDSPAIGFLSYALTLFLNLLVALLLLPAPYLVVDRDEGILDAIGESARSMSGNMLVALGAYLVVLIGVLAFSAATLLVGVLLAAPFLWLFQAVLYLKVTGQKTAY